MNVLGYTESGLIRVIFEGDEAESIVPDDMSNRHRQMIAEWEAAGNTIPALPVALPTIEDYRAAIQALVDNTAKSRRYDSGTSLASYVVSTIPVWSAEATTFVTWRDQVWAYAYAELTKVEAGEREQPSVAAFLDELPQISWPASEPVV